MGPNFRSAIATVLVLMALTAGCKRSKTEPAAAPSPQKPSPAQPAKKYPPRVTINFTPSKDPNKDLAEAIQRLGSAYPYRVTFSQTAGDRPTVTFVVEYVAGDEFRLRDSSGAESVNRGANGYSRSPFPPSNGEWIQNTSPQSIGEIQEASVRKNLPTDPQNVKAAGNETLNGVSCFVFTYSRGAQAGKAWIGADGLLYQIDEDSKKYKQHYAFEYTDVQEQNWMR